MAILEAARKVGLLTTDNTLYIGEVAATDEALGVRITLLDESTGLFNGHDLFVTWTQVRRVWICNNEHEVGRFVHEMEQMVGAT
ncbi:hypothetical protein Mal52_44730 [Symmachiella dynata]|uniref:Uncharacterized protein n=1 Tax=Symmachiella dynata TaxID=2527995 RepID=A0A517ZU21_9PLAN|nr:hypothetical protein [Symmachiella dynata]QDU45976.1 hypothetical protein Mal52_44730 [Symmachiella dynata]